MGGCLSSQPASQPAPHAPLPAYAQQASAQAYGQWQAPAAQQFQQPCADLQQPWQPPKFHHAPGGCGDAQAPFMRTAAPNASSWAEYVQTGCLGVDPATGFLAGPWAECICQGVRFEHANDWQRSPEYASGDGPVGGIISALEAAVAGRPDSRQLLDAANRLEEAAHAAADMGRPLPVIDELQDTVAQAQPCHAQPLAYEQGHCGQPAYDGRAGFGEPAFGQHSSYGQPAYSGQPYGQHPAYQPAQMPGAFQPGYASGPEYGQVAHYQSQPPYGAPYGAGGPTLLQQHGQNVGGGVGGGMGDGGKMAMAAAGGVAAGVGGYYLASHMDDVGDALGGALGAVGHAGGAAMDFAGDVVGDVGGFVGDVAGDAVDFVEDVF